ncbi:hypothetical protein D3C71_1430390 [compost metagenome]
MLQQHLHLFQRQHRILEEAARIAEHVRIGQLAAADVDHRVGYIGGHRQFHPHRLHFLGDPRIAQAQAMQQRQPQFDRGDQVTVRVVLEDAVAVGELAAFRIEAHPVVFVPVPGIHGLDELADLRAIGTDVLDR